MPSNLRKLLPTRDEGRKLWIEVWKYFLVACLAAISLFFASVRSLLAEIWRAFAEFASSSVQTRGWLLLVLAICTAGTVLRLGAKLYHLRGGTHVRGYTKGHFDGIDWIWRWRSGRVDQSSLRAFCPICQTEIQLSPANEGRDTNVFCTTCNVGRQFVNVSDLRDHVWRKIEANVRTGRWRQGSETQSMIETPQPAQSTSPSATLNEQELVRPFSPSAVVPEPLRSHTTSTSPAPIEQLAVTRLDATPEDVARMQASLQGRFGELHAYESSLNRRYVVWPAKVHQVVHHNEAMPITVYFDPGAHSPMRWASFQRSLATRLFALHKGDIIEVSGVLSRAMPGQFKVDADEFRLLEHAGPEQVS